jgi:hypothetical protein
MKNTFLFLIALGLCYSCSDGQNKLETELEAKMKQEAAAASDKLEDERNRLEEERLALKAEREAAQIQKEKDAENARLQDQFSQSDLAMVNKSRAYFHSEPRAETINKRKFLIRGNEIRIIRMSSNGFGYVEYYNEENDKYTAGWLDLHDLAPIVYGC